MNKTSIISERRNTAEEAHEIIVFIENEQEFHEFNDMFTELGYEYGLIPEDYPLYIFFDLRYKDTTHLPHNEIPNFEFDWDNNKILWGVYKKIFTIEDFELVKEILEKGKIIERPTYKTRKIVKFNESVENDIKWHVFVFEDTYEFQKIQEFLFKLDYKWCTGEKTIVEDINDHSYDVDGNLIDEDTVLEMYPGYIFVSVKKNIFFFSGYNTLDQDSSGEQTILQTIRARFDGDLKSNELNDQIYTVNDFDIASRKLRPEKFTPSYKPKKVDRVYEGVGDKYDIVVIRTENYDEVKNILDVLYDKDYKWASGNQRYTNYGVYPYYLWLENGGVIYHLMNLNDDKVYSFIDEENESVTSDKRIVRKIFRPDDIYFLDRLFKYGVPSPDYSPRKIDRMTEKYNTLEEAREILVQINNFDEYDQITEIFESYNYWGSVPTEDDGINFPLYLFFHLDKNYVTFLDYMDKELVDNFEHESLLDYVYKQRFTIDDINTIDTILRTGKIRPPRPPRPLYTPRKISRLYEFIENDKIAIYINSESDFNTVKETISKYGYKIDPGYNDVIKELRYKAIIVLDIPNVSTYVVHQTYYKSEGDSGVYDVLLSVKDINVIKEILGR